MDKAVIIQQMAEELIRKIGFEIAVSVALQDGVYVINLADSEDTSLIIGKYGATLRSIQTVLDTMIFAEFEESVDIMVNVSDYRERQKERIETIAENIASRVAAEGRLAILPAFSSYERKLIHEYIATNHPTLTSHSEGEGRERKLVVEAKK